MQAVKAIAVKPYKIQEDWTHSAVNIQNIKQFISLVLYKEFLKHVTKYLTQHKDVFTTSISEYILRRLYQLYHFKMLNNRKAGKGTMLEKRQRFDFWTMGG